MLGRIISFFRGYLLIEISGNALERLINQIIDRGIKLWQIERINSSLYRAKINIKDFNILRPIVRNRKCWVKISYKGGLPFLLLRARRRYYLLFGFIFFITIFWLGSSFLWFIEIEGLETIPGERIYQILAEEGVKPGIFKANIDLSILEKKLIEEEPRIVWIDLIWQGTKLKARIVEKKIVEKTEAGNLVARRDGVISKLIVLKGRAAVEEGDTVTVGQTLIVGGKDSSGKKEPARGIVNGYVWYEEYGEAELKFKEILYTGKKRTAWGIKVNSRAIFLPPSEPPFKSYLVESKVKSWSGWRNIDFPIEFIIKEYKEVEYLVEDLERDVALFIAKERAMERILEKSLNPGAIIISTEANEVEVINEEKVRVQILMKVEENLAELVATDKEDFSG